MKFIRLLTLALCLTVFCSGCKANSSAGKMPVAPAGYTCSADISMGSELSAKADIAVPGGGIMVITLKEPIYLNGMKFSLDREDITVTYNGLECPIKLPKSYGSFAGIMGSAFLKLSTGEPSATKNGDNWVFKGTAMSVDFEFILNNEGLPVRLSVPSKNLTVEFSDWQYVM